jgi:predicted nucleic acid-binding protein
MFLHAVADGEHTVVMPTGSLFRRAVEIDAGYAALGLGLVDALVMAIAEERRLPILTFDFEHFRATRPRQGYWELVVDESRYRDSTSS